MYYLLIAFLHSDIIFFQRQKYYEIIELSRNKTCYVSHEHLSIDLNFYSRKQILKLWYFCIFFVVGALSMKFITRFVLTLLFVRADIYLRRQKLHFFILVY